MSATSQVLDQKDTYPTEIELHKDGVVFQGHKFLNNEGFLIGEQDVLAELFTKMINLGLKQ